MIGLTQSAPVVGTGPSADCGYYLWIAVSEASGGEGAVKVSAPTGERLAVAAELCLSQPRQPMALLQQRLAQR